MSNSNTKRIPMRGKLGRGIYALVDADDYEWLSQYKWSLSLGYAHSCDKRLGGRAKMHRLIIGAKRGQLVDHANQDPLDNRRENLRFCTKAENAINSKIPANNTSGHKGVHWDRANKKWRASIKIDQVMYNLGRYKEIEDAIRARHKAEITHFGEFSPLWDGEQ